MRLGTEYARSLYPPESTFLLDVDELEAAGVVVLVARGEAGRAIGMAALVPVDDTTAELKRMFVRPDARGRGLATHLLDHLEEQATAVGRTRIVLDTGTLHAAAISLYRRCGYVDIDQFGQYVDEPFSRCMARHLPPSTPALTARRTDTAAHP